VRRVTALVAKDLAELRRTPSIFLPAMLTGLASAVYPFVIAVIVPHATGERLADSSDLQVALEMYRLQPGVRALSAEGAIQAWVFQQALVLMASLTTIAASMAIAAHGIVGEKLARTLEPLLATPLSTFELLAAKVLVSIVPGVAVMLLWFGLYLAGVAFVAEPGVWTALLLPRSLAVLLVLGPLSALVALQLAVCASSRAHDARSAQQLGALIVVPIGVFQVAQFLGVFRLTAVAIAGIAGALLALNAALMLVAIRLFDREAILTRWR
jgi:ABC-2 type transport system permease protein